MKVSELGEFGLIQLLSDIVGKEGTSRQPLVGIGDDAAAWQSDDSILLATTDTMVQGVHFTEQNWRELGWKAVAINLSDIAAMGGIPLYALISLSLPEDTEVDDVARLYQGMAEVANQFQVAIVGGNLSNAPIPVITVTLIGEALSEGILTRSGALVGDQIAITGYLGASAAGLKVLTHRVQFDPPTIASLSKAHLQPQPRIAEGQILVRQGVRAAIDISDGLIADLGHLCQASQVGAIIRIDQIPIHPLVRDAFPNDSLSLAMTGGEDYELLFATSREVIEEVKLLTDCPVTAIGEMIEGKPGEVTLIDKEGKPFQLSGKGWEHFKKR